MQQLAVTVGPDGAAADRAIARLREELGDDIVHHSAVADLPRHRRDFLNAAADDLVLHGVAYPRTTDHVSRILRICNEERLPVIPQGGRTGMAGGATPVVAALALSLERMREIEELDPDGRTIRVQAGTVLEAVQNAADEAGFFFPLDLGGRGTAQIGGNAATNAGGNRVLRYGMMRDLVLGIEVVLADGTIVTSLNTMLKNNAGYDIRNMFIGSEGTLGVITRLVLRLFPKPLSTSTALVGVTDFAAALLLMREASSRLGGSLAAFEVMWSEFYHLGTTALGRQPPLPHGFGLYVLIETLGTDQEQDDARFEQVIGGLIEADIVQDAVIASSSKQRQELWAIRDCPGEFPKIYWPQIAFDVSLPAARIGDFVPHIRAVLQRHWPDVQTVFFGHLADSNLHLSVRLPREVVPVEEIEETVYREVGAWQGSISAEHGIGMVKREFLHFSRSPEELSLMRLLKSTLDPNGILNPGKVL